MEIYVSELVNTIRNHISSGLSYNDACRIERGKSYKISYGVESGGKNNKTPDFLDEEELMNCEAVSYKVVVDDFYINNVELRQNNIWVNFDRIGNILIGMDILKNWDIHMGTAKNGDTVFLGCPREQMNNGYLDALEQLIEESAAC